MKKTIAMLTVTIIIGIIILSCLIINFIKTANDLVNNGQVVELVIDTVIGVGLVITYKLLNKKHVNNYFTK